jgi:hypothetical protein
MFLDFPHIISYVVIVFFLNLSPGADVLFVCGQTIKGGKSHGFSASLGISVGIILYAIITAFGVAEILKASPFIFSLIKWSGIGYLFYLAYQAFTSQSMDFKMIDHQKVTKDLFKTFRQAFFTNILNPKAFLFFFSFLPQFTNPESSIPLYIQLMCLGLWVSLSGFAVSMMYTLLITKVRPYLLQNTLIQTRLQQIMGVIFILLAINLLWEDLKVFLF